MTLKNSFLVRLVENAKRRLWILVIALLLFVLAIPISTAMEISRIQAMEESLGLVKMQKQLYDRMFDTLSFHSGTAILAGCFAVLAGIQGFSYLYDRSKIDFYHSKPVKSSKRFTTIWINGVLVYVIPSLLGTILNVLLVAASGVMDTALFVSVCEAVVLLIALYIAVYSIAILAVMLTGKTLITLMGIGVFLFYEMAVRSLFTGCCSFFFDFYHGYNGDDWYMPLISPFYMLNKYMNDEWGLVLTVIGLLVFAAAVLVLAFWCYKKRPSELAGSAMTFQGIKPVIKIGVSVPVAIFAGMATAGLMEYSPIDGSGSPFFPILLGVIFVVLSNALIQVIFEADIRGMFHKKRDIVITAVLSFVIVLVFRYDLIGFDSRIPEMSQIESVEMVTDTNEMYSRMYYDASGKLLTKEEYLDKYMFLTGSDAENVRELALYSIEQYEKYPNRRAFFDDEQENANVIYKFRLKSGRIVTRSIPVLLRDETAKGLIGKIETSETFIRTNEPAMSEYLFEAVMDGDHMVDAVWGNGMYQEDMTYSRVCEFLKVYREDLLNDSYKVKCEELPIGQVEMFLDKQVSYGRRVRMTVYPSYANSVAFLQENGYKIEKYVALEDIDHIQIQKYYETEEENISIETEVGFAETVAIATEGESCYVEYVDAQEIAEIMNHAYPMSLSWEYWYQESPYDEGDHVITVYFKEESKTFEENGYAADFYFLKDEVPSFVLEDLPRDAAPEK